MAQRILIVGAGVAGTLLLHGLSRAPGGLDITCVEQTYDGEHEGAGTGLNIGPNAIASLRTYFPDLSTDLEAAGLPWRQWSVKLVSGAEIMRLDFKDIASNAGLRLRWADLYRILRRSVRKHIEFATEFVSAELQTADGKICATIKDRQTGSLRSLADIDLLIGCDGRFSRIRAQAFPLTPRRYLGAALYRLLIENVSDVAINDYTQWFHGPHRLLAFRALDNAVYLSGTFPLAPGDQISARQMTSDYILDLFADASQLERPVQFLLDSVGRASNQLHWSRLHDEDPHFIAYNGRLLLLGDAAHPIVPTLGQGATLSIEDGCVAQEELCARCSDIQTVARAVETRRLDRVLFARHLSWHASDTLLAGSDPVTGTLNKTTPEFRDKLVRLYNDVPIPVR